MQKSLEKQKDEVIEIPLKELHAAAFNPNQIDEPEYRLLKADMEKGGLMAISPIDIAQVGEGYLIVNGHSRVRAAEELGWKTIRAILDPLLHTEEQAILVGYKRNRERGKINPFREASLFNRLLSDPVNPWTKQQIAKEFGMNEQTVSQRLQLEKLTKDAKDLISVPGYTIAHLLPIAKLPEEAQHRMVKEIRERLDDYSAPKSQRMTILAQEVQQDLRKEKELNDAISASKFQTCPDCQLPPEGISYKGLPWVQDKKYHNWSLKTGRSEEEQRNLEKKAAKKTGNKEEVRPKFIRSTHTPEEFARVFQAIALENLPRVAKIESLHLSGKTAGGDEIEISGEFYDDNAMPDLFVHRGNVELGFSIKPRNYTPEELAQYKSAVYPNPDSSANGGLTEKEQKELEKQVEALFKKYGNGTPTKKVNKK